MLKLLSKTRFPGRLLHKALMKFSQPFHYKEQEFLSDDETEPNFRFQENQFEMYKNIQKALTVEDVIKTYEDNNLNYKQVDLIAFQFVQLIKQGIKYEKIEEFIEKHIIPNLTQLTPEQVVQIMILLLKLYHPKPYFAAEIKKYADQSIDKFNHLQLSYVYLFYCKNGFKSFRIGRKLKSLLNQNTFTAHSLCQIIRACYLESRSAKYCINPEIVFSACKQLLTVKENVNINGKIAVFYQISKLKLQQTSSQKKFPPIMFDLIQEFQQNIQKLSLHSKLKILEAYTSVPDSFPFELYDQVIQSLENDSITPSDTLKLYITLKSQRSKHRPSDDKLNSILNKINWDEIRNENLFLQFLDKQNYNENENLINLSISKLKRCDLTSKQKIDLIKAIIKHNKIEEIFDLIQNDPESLTRLIDQAYYSHHYIISNKYPTTEEKKEAILQSVSKLMVKLNELDLKAKISICHYIITFEPYQNDPFYEFVQQNLNLKEIPEKDLIPIVLRLESKINLNTQLRKQIDDIQLNLEQLKSMINQLSTIKFLNDKLIRAIAQHLLELSEKSLIDESFEINLTLNLVAKLIINSPLYTLHNMRGTVSQQVREILLFLSKQVYQTQQQIIIDVNVLIKFNDQLNQLNFRTSLINNIVENLCQQTNQQNPEIILQIGKIITEINVYSFKNIEVIKNYLNKVASLDVTQFSDVLIKAKVLLFLMKHQAKFNQQSDDIQLGLIIDQLKLQIISYQLNSQSKEQYLDALMTLLDYDGFRINYKNYEDDGLSDFIENNMQNVDSYLNMKNMRGGLKIVIKTLNQYDTKHQFIKKYEKVFAQMFKKCRQTRNDERPHISACLDYIEFAKKLKINDKETIEYLIYKIIDQIDNLKQVQIVDTIQKLSEQKILLHDLFDKLSERVLSKIHYYSNIELLDIMSAYTKVGYFYEHLFKEIIKSVSHKFLNQNNVLGSVQYFWSLLIASHIFKKSHDKYDILEQNEKFVTILLQDVLKFSNSPQNAIIPIVFRQYMDIYNLLELSLHQGFQFNQQQQQIAKKIVEAGRKIVQDKMIPNQKLNTQFKSLIQFLDRMQIEYKINYFFDNQYVDCYIPQKNLIIQIDNSIYVTQDMESYTGFHYFNKWILESIAKKYELKVIRISAWKWVQYDEEQKLKILQI